MNQRQRQAEVILTKPMQLSKPWPDREDVIALLLCVAIRYALVDQPMGRCPQIRV